MMRRIVIAFLLVAAVEVAAADEYWIAYEGNDFPENEGWVRHASDPPAGRWLESGRLFIDSRADVDITENYAIYFENGLDPEQGETFVMRWRLKVNESHLWDSGVFVKSDELWTVSFIFEEDSLVSVFERNVSAKFEPGVFHFFELRSGDMRSYELYIDDRLALEGKFFEGLFSPRVGWGDIVRGGASLAEWDYFRFGVVPEPSCLVMVFTALACICKRRICSESVFWIARA